MLFAEVRAEDWLWMTDSQKRGKSDKGTNLEWWGIPWGYGARKRSPKGRHQHKERK